MNITEWVLVATIVLLLIYDAIVGYIGQPTESQILRDWARNHTGLPFVAGFLLAHWFINDMSLGPSGWMLALPMILTLVAWDAWYNHKPRGTRPWYRSPTLWALAGIPVGALLWGQAG